MSLPDAELEKAFPAALREDALRMISALPEASSTAGAFSAEIGEEIVWIPFRIYHDPTLIDASRLTGTQRDLLACLLTRHHSGFVRAEYLSRIINCNREWIPPFVVQLVGEYVIEIIRSIRSGIPHLDREVYGEFLMRNPAFYQRTKERVLSYWDCYHRGERREDYAGFEVLDFFDSLTSRHRE